MTQTRDRRVSPSTPRFKTTQRMVLFGATDSGKTYLARRVWSSIPPPRLVVDPKDDIDATGGGYQVTFHDPSKLPEVPVARWVPPDPMDRDAYDRLYGSVWDSDRRWFVWLDEAAQAAPARSGMPRRMARHVTQGRGKGLGHIAANQRPVDVDPNLVGQAEHVIVFRLGYPPDLDTAAAQLSMRPADLRRNLGSTGRYGFCWYSRPDNRVYVVDAVQ